MARSARRANPIHLSGLLCLGLVLSASAQELTDTTRAYSVEGVTVIEARTGIDPARLPYSASIHTIGVAASARADALAGALGSIPGVFAASRSGGTDLRLTIRGFGARGNGDRSNSGTIRGIKVLLDGIPITEPDGRTSPDLLTFLNAGRVEVLRTNASVLFGNASGGVVNVESAEPTEDPTWSLLASAGSFGLRKWMGRFGMPFERGSLTVSGGSLSLDGWRSNSAVDAASVYAVAVARPSDELRVRATLGLTRHRFGIPGALTDAEYASDPSMADPIYAQRRERRDNLVAVSSLSVTRSIGGVHSVTASAFIGPRSLLRSERNTYREFQRWSGGGGMVWRWVPSPSTMVAVGADGSLQDGGSLFYALVNGERGDSLRTNKAERAGSAGIFVEAATALTGAWSISGGLRFDRQHYRSSVFPAGGNLTTRVESLTFGHATPHLGLSYRIDDRQSAFASLSGGLEVPAFNEVDPPPGIGAADLNPLLKPMTSTTYEVGHRFRGKVFDHWDVMTSASVFLITVRDEIVPFNNGAWFLSAGRSQRQGVEVDATIRGEHGVEAYIALTAMHAEYREFSSSAGTFSGNEVPGIPGHTLVIRLSGEVAEGLTIEIGGRRVGRMTVDDANTLRIPASNVLDAAVSWRTHAVGAKITLRGDVRNLLDAAYTSGAFINPATRPTLPPAGSGAAPAYREPGLPRNFVLTVSVGS